MGPTRWAVAVARIATNGFDDWYGGLLLCWLEYWQQGGRTAVRSVQADSVFLKDLERLFAMLLRYINGII